jgi:imidazolonepropionase-like amidohydrolase
VPEPPSVDTIVTGALVWDGTDRPPVSGGAVAIRGGVVAACGPRADVPISAAARVLDFPDATVLPGLIDTHVHLIWPGDGTPNHTFTTAATDAELLLVAVRNAQRVLRAGVTTVRDLGSRGRVVLDLRDAITRGILAGPRIVASGSPITISGGHMHYLGGEADGGPAIRRRARALWRLGVDLFKVVGEGGGTPRTHSWIPTYAEAELAVAAAEARDHETHVTVHANTIEAVRRAVRAGVNGIEHCSLYRARDDVGYDPALVDQIAERGIYVGHTLTGPYRSLEQARDRWAELSGDERASWDTRRRTWEARLVNYGKMLQAGVRLVASTDAGWSLVPFGEYALTLELIVRAGASPRQALIGATRLAAEAVGLGRQAGTLEPGKWGDLTVVDGNPFEDIARVEHVRCVMQGGAVVVDDGGLR